MAKYRHPVTGVALNLLDVHRKALDPADIETAHLLRKDGHKLHDIAAMLGVNAGRVAEILGGEPPGSDSGGTAQLPLL